jgi:hypothetical protein
MLALISACDQRPSQNDLAAENDRLWRASMRVEIANANYESCLSDAGSAYRSRWDATCARLRREDLRQRANCRAGSDSDEACLSIEVAAGENCALPTNIARDYDANYRDDQMLCLERLRVEY